MRVSHRFTTDSVRFDEDNLVSCAGLVPVLGLTQQTRLPEIIAAKVSIKTPRIRSGAANPVPKLISVIAGMRLRAGKTGSGKGAGRMVAQAIATARAAGTSGKILVRGDSAYGNRAVVRACRRGKVQFSLVMAKNRAIQRAIDSIAADQWTPVRYPNAVPDPDTPSLDL